MISKTKPMAFSSEVAVARLSNVLASRHLLTKNWKKKQNVSATNTKNCCLKFTPYTPPAQQKIDLTAIRLLATYLHGKNL